MYQRYVAPDRTQAHYVWVGRAFVAVLLVVGYVLSVQTFDFLVVLVTLSGAGALQLMPAILGVCFPGRRALSKAGVLAGLFAGLATLYVTLLVTPHPLGVHGALWSLMLNGLVAVVVSAATEGPTEATVRRIHGEVERQVYGAPGTAAAPAVDAPQT
ncbi:MAG: hypothetical protein GWM90_23525 [Gemmatimonadetes bacterium]|nr:hypothetical protein [Gemmatimonadota bacterium]NIQ57642.1 hypothetical protein [Gemmatimonadota bacterium]NIU77809.1 hypothetical protein [Gammaproteobacteria bacterium]NIX46941.1 hypothetical protein [Gemmatimonadota bacterium]NIY11290.1 hypothetical protein [Gemmatimonadota bacterium]